MAVWLVTKGKEGQSGLKFPAQLPPTHTHTISALSALPDSWESERLTRSSCRTNPCIRRQFSWCLLWGAPWPRKEGFLKVLPLSPECHGLGGLAHKKAAVGREEPHLGPSPCPPLSPRAVAKNWQEKLWPPPLWGRTAGSPSQAQGVGLWDTFPFPAPKGWRSHCWLQSSITKTPTSFSFLR